MKKVIKVRDINKNGKKDGFEKARAKGMAKGMGARVELKSGGGLYANIHENVNVLQLAQMKK